MISSKFLHDDGEEDEVFMDEWAQSGDISVWELCQLEKEFLGAIVSNVKNIFYLTSFCKTFCIIFSPHLLCNRLNL